MNLLSGLNWLTSRASRRAAAHDNGIDPADMGTAFGLDASMGPETPAPARSAAPKQSGGDAAHSLSDRLVRRPHR